MLIQVLHDWRLLFICSLGAIVTILLSATVASRPAAIITKRVALSTSIHHIFFMITRFANIFYLPLLANFVDKAEITHNSGLLVFQLRMIIIACSVGSLFAWLLLPTFIELFKKAIMAVERNESMVKVLFKLILPKNWKYIFGSFRVPNNFGVSLLKTEGVPIGFLIINVIGQAIWTVGVLCAMYASFIKPEYATSSILLSGLVNAFAAIIFSVLVDPKSSLITDQAIAGQRPERHVYIVAIFLSAGNLLGAILAQFFLEPGARLIMYAASYINEGVGANLLFIILINVVVTLLASTAVVSRISSVITKRVATAIAVYNLFFLVTRLAQQIYAPLIGAIVDSAGVHSKAIGVIVDSVEFQHKIRMLEGEFRWVIFGATIGVAIGWLLIPTFVEIFNKAIWGMDKYGSFPALFIRLFRINSLKRVVSCFKRPSLLGVKLNQIKLIPQSFLYYNIFVVAIYTIGVMAAAFSSVFTEAERTATLLSSVINGVATILLGIVVDPLSSLITDQAVAGKRPAHHVNIMAVFLIAGTLLGTILSQVLLMPSVKIIAWAAGVVDKLF